MGKRSAGEPAEGVVAVEVAHKSGDAPGIVGSKIAFTPRHRSGISPVYQWGSGGQKEVGLARLQAAKTLHRSLPE